MKAPSTRQSPAILDLRQRKTPSNKSNDTRTYIDFKTLRFQNVFLPHKYEKPKFSNSSGRKSVQKLLGFRDGLERTVGQSVELRKLRFHIFPALCGCCLRNSAIIGLRVAIVRILMLFAFEECSINSLLSIQAQRCRYVKRPLKRIQVSTVWILVFVNKRKWSTHVITKWLVYVHVEVKTNFRQQFTSLWRKDGRFKIVR